MSFSHFTFQYDGLPRARLSEIGCRRASRSDAKWWGAAGQAQFPGRDATAIRVDRALWNRQHPRRRRIYCL